MPSPSLGSFGVWAHHHRARVIIAWVIITVSLGAFAPRLEHSLSGAMWEVRGSESLDVRQVIEDEFGGLSSQSGVVVLHSETLTLDDAQFSERIEAVDEVFRTEPAYGDPLPAQPSQDGHTAMIQAGSLVNPTESVRAAERIAGDVEALNGDGITVALTGSPAFWADFNEVNKEGMMRAELFTWPVTAFILLLAFGTLAAAGLPLMLTAAGLVSAMGLLFGITQFTDLSIWTFNFAVMFALALGIDYSLFIVSRFRAALHATPDDSAGAVAITMDTAGKAVLFSGLTVLISLAAVLLVPIPAFQSMAAGMMLAVALVLLAALTLLPAMLGHGINRIAMPWHSAGEHRSGSWLKFSGWVQSRPKRMVVVVLGGTLLLASPLIALETGMPSISVLPDDKPARVGYDLLAAAFGPGGPGPIQVIVPAGANADAAVQTISANDGIAATFPPLASAEGSRLIVAIASTDPSASETLNVIRDLREELSSNVLVGGPVAENADLDQTLRDRAPLVIGTVLVLGFVLLLIALQSPVIAVVGVALNLLSVGAAFGVGALAFQHGWLAGPMGFESQGYLTSWAPLFFFTLVFAISMDYTVFLLASAKEHFETSGDAKEALAGAVAHTGRPIVAAAGVMVAVFFTFALFGPLPMKEMGIILGVAVLIDALAIRLVLVPALLTLIGDAAWWMPGWAYRVLPNVRFAH